MPDTHDVVIIGAGAAGVTAARYAARFGVKVALVEKARVGGDCTWSGCVPSKALLKAAKVAHGARTGAHFGLLAEPPRIDMAGVRAYIRQVIADVYRHETPEQLASEGVTVLRGKARFLDSHTLRAGANTLSARHFIIATGARPLIPPIEGLANLPFQTYETIFDSDCLPKRLIVIGAGAVGAEFAQAYQRLGTQVTLIDAALLPHEEPEAGQVLGQVFASEGIHYVQGLVASARPDEGEIVFKIQKTGQEVRGDMVLVATGRAPALKSLALERAGVAYSPDGIRVDRQLRTTARHIYAAGDCVMGGHKFTHFAGWQAFQAVRNALLPGGSQGFSTVVPSVTFTDPEVAQVGLTEAEARQKFGRSVRVKRWNLDRTDRALCENDRAGFFKVIHKKDGTILGATIVAGRAGEAITEFVLALQNKLKLSDLAMAIHPYPTYSAAVMRLAAEVSIENAVSGLSGTIIRKLAGAS